MHVSSLVHRGGALLLAACTSAAPAPASGAAPAFGDAFWGTWGDGKAELAAYDLTTPRYGEPRAGLAVTVFVTETFDLSAGVKAETDRCCTGDQVPVLKLNLVQDFATGLYDYNLMGSVFVAVADQSAGGTSVDGGTSAHMRAGDPVKVSFSAQEWCGHVYHQLRPRRGGIESVRHSYFQGEGDRSRTLPAREGVFEDALLHWARGFARPVLAPGERIDVQALPALRRARLQHFELGWVSGSLMRAAAPETVTVPAGTFEVERREAVIGQGEGGARLTFWVETAAPHRIIKWQSAAGEVAQLVASARLPYWKLHGLGNEALLGELGLERRSPRTP